MPVGLKPALLELSGVRVFTLFPFPLHPLIALLDLLNDPRRLLQLPAQLPNQTFFRLDLLLIGIDLAANFYTFLEARVVFLEHAHVVFEGA